MRFSIKNYRAKQPDNQQANSTINNTWAELAIVSNYA